MSNWQVSEIFEPTKLNINQWSKADRPREKLATLGAASLSKAELLAILIGSGNTDKSAVELMKDILHDCNDSLNRLGRMDVEQLMEYKGIGEAKAITILAACELGRRCESEEAEQLPDLGSAQNIYKYMHPKVKHLNVEQAWALFLNSKMQLIKLKRLSEGGYTETAVDVRLIIKEALMCNATVVGLIHNHPSGNPNPSRDDDKLTHQVQEACKLMRLYLIDHVVIGSNDFYSYRENGKL